MRILTLILVLTLASPLAARDLTPAERLSDFDTLVSLIRTTYGVLEYKKQHLGIDLDTLAGTYRPQIEAAQTDERFYALMNMFTAEFRDGHFGLSNPSVRRARLGFRCARVEDKAVIWGINRKVLGDAFPFAAGDELVALDGKPVARIVEELAQLGGQGNEAAALEVATGVLTWRHGAFGAVPTGVVRVDVKRRSDGQVLSVMLPWLVDGETLPGLSFHGRARRGSAVLPDARPGDLALNLAASAQPPGAGAAGPADAQPVESKYFTASIFDSPKGPMGYIRIPDFMPDDTDAALVEMKRLLGEMRFTRGLVLDLADNPGGYITYCYQLAALFLSKPLEMQTISLRASRRLLSVYLEWAEEASDHPLYEQLAKTTVGLLRTALEKDVAMTEFGFPYGISSIAGGGAYDKPILVIINERSFSCGDIFPALMQDNRRATLFGHTTGGGGGAVSNFGALPNSGMSIRMTVNLWKRSSGGFIENNGVAPDIAYEHTQNDVAEGFKAYREAYTKALLDLVK